MEDDYKKINAWIASVLGMLLLSGNIYFVKRLVDRLDEQGTMIWQLRQDVVILKLTIDGIHSYKKKGE